MSGSNDISGHWTGVFDYPDSLFEPVPFQAIFFEQEGLLSGEITEPNTFSPDATRNLCAAIIGTRSGMQVSFVKMYDQRTEAEHEVRYEGDLNSDFTKIEGFWSVIEDHGWSGPFIMNRTPARKETIKLSESVGDKI